MPTETLTYEDPQARLGEPAAQPHLFRVVHGDEPTAESWRHALDAVDQVRIGRARAYGHAREDGGRTLVIGLPDRHTSSAHAVVRKEGDGFVLDDAGSKNGCFVNGVREKRRTLADGDVLRVGHTLFVFRAALLTRPGIPLDSSLSTHAPTLASLVPALAADFEHLAHFARTRASILLSGETGSGKEVAARTVHALSRAAGPFVGVNCAALPPHLLESEMFGHRRGAFTGAVSDHPGLFRAAEGGTLFLDEIAELPAAAQAALLRVLQEGEVRPVGSPTPIKVDVRVVAATHQDLRARVASGLFREDLYARLAGFSLRLPALRERREDLGCVIATILRKHDAHVTMTPEAAERLLAYAWPRNIRELEGALVHAFTLAQGEPIRLEHLPASTRAAAPIASPITPPKASFRRVDDPELRMQLVDALRAHRGNVVRVAEQLRTSRTQVHRWIERYALDLGAFRKDD